MTVTRESARVQAAAREPTVAGAVVAYRLYDVGYEIRLDRALELLATSAPARPVPARGEAQAIQIKNPPVTVPLGTDSIQIAGAPCAAEVSARIFDFGVISLRIRVEAPEGTPWSGFAALGNRMDAGTELVPRFAHHLRLVLERMGPAIERPALAPVTEDYVVFRIQRMTGADGSPVSLEQLRDEDLIPLLLNERRSLSSGARRELLPYRFSYYPDDLAVLTWDNALIVEPAPEDNDVQYVLEFANAQLLELRVYDTLLDAELPKMYDRVTRARAELGMLLRRRFASILTDLQTLVADSTELVERVENALKLTGDVYLARVYSAALGMFHVREWRQGIDRKLAIIRDTYEMLNAESQAARSEALEIIIVILIVIEIVIAFVPR